MPTVPTVQGPSVAATGLPDAFQTTPNGIAGAGEARTRQLAQAAQTATAASGFLQAQQNRDDLDVVFRAETGLKDDYLKFERDELGKAGVDAKGATERTQQWWQDAERRYGEGLTERQLFAFRRSATTLRQSSASTLARHEQHQANESLKASSQARVGSAIDMAIADPVPARLEVARKEITEAVALASKAAGLPPEAAQAKLSEALTLMHRGVVLRMVDTDPDAAKAYYYTNRKEIAGGTQATLEKTLDHGGRLQKAQEAADDIMVKFPDLDGAMAHIEKTYQGEDEKAIKAEVRDRWTTQKTAKNVISQQAYETALLATVQGRKVPAEAWAKMDDGHKAAILEKQEAEGKARAREAEGKPVKTDFGAWDALNRMVTDDPKAFAALDLGRYADKVSRQDLEEFGKLQRRVRSGDDKPVKNAVTLAQQVDVVADQLKLRPNSEDSAAMRKSIYDALNAETQRTGKDLTYEERQKVIDRQVMEVAVPGRFFGTTEKRAFQLTPAERAKAAPTDDDRKAIVDRLKAKGVAKPTEAQVLATFRAWKGL